MSSEPSPPPVSSVSAAASSDRRSADRPDGVLVVEGATALAQLAAGLVLGMDSAELADRLFERLAPSMDLDCYIHYVIDAEAGDGSLRLAATAGLTPDQVDSLGTLRQGESAYGLVARYGEPRTIHDVAPADEPGTELLRDLQVSAHVSHPLLTDGELVGTLWFGSRRRTSFHDVEVELLRTAGDVLAAAVGKALAEAGSDARPARSTEVPDAWLEDQVVELEVRVSALRWEARTRDVIAQAAGVIMERHRMSGPAAFEHLRRTARDHRTSLYELCTHILAASSGRAS